MRASSLEPGAMLDPSRLTASGLPALRPFSLVPILLLLRRNFVKLYKHISGSRHIMIFGEVINDRVVAANRDVPLGPPTCATLTGNAHASAGGINQQFTDFTRTE